LVAAFPEAWAAAIWVAIWAAATAEQSPAGRVHPGQGCPSLPRVFHPRNEGTVANVIMWLVMIPMMVFAVQFWANAARWAIRNKRDIAGRVQRVRSAFVEGMRGEE
jgi:hypothetical protein